MAAVWLKVSNNGEAEGRKTALQLADDATLPPIEFDWSEWEGASRGGKREPKVREEHWREVFEDGERWLTQKAAAGELMELTGVGRSTAHLALKVVGGRFSALLIRNPDTKLVSMRSSTQEPPEP